MKGTLGVPLKQVVSRLKKISGGYQEHIETKEEPAVGPEKKLGYCEDAADYPF